eukprot:CAMPEP_0174276080 /NCGR_PEP_ID=MMETSP0439-20130205/60187_1 /TAXON_ID=0 /ORGANISM="Stereomyxa ramosa, Strain Chinc5" /LENGTH=142 /DNA_ID=CAMNT_0015368269 /DNA_START=1399 /DNA_END=1824 /DNA_ORIENTATION=+
MKIGEYAEMELKIANNTSSTIDNIDAGMGFGQERETTNHMATGTLLMFYYANKDGTLRKLQKKYVGEGYGCGPGMLPFVEKLAPKEIKSWKLKMEYLKGEKLHSRKKERKTVVALKRLNRRKARFGIPKEEYNQRGLVVENW